MASAILVNVKEEVTCPICLELLAKPLSLDCGHNFCQSCITSNYQSTKGQKGESRCPVCRITYQFENLRHNRSMANIVERLKEIKLGPEEGQNVYRCARHREKLQLFCKEDSKVICLLCERSQEHRGHYTVVMEEVADEYQEKLQETVKELMKKWKISEEWKTHIQKERTFWKNQMKDEIRSVQAQFEKLRGILDSEEKNELQQLGKEEEDILNSLAESENELVQHSQVVRDLISNLQQRLEGSTIEMLQDVNDIMERCKTLMLKKPKTSYKKERRVIRVSNLIGLQDSQDLTDVQRYWVHVTLAPSKNPTFVISPDQREIRYERKGAFWSANYPEGVLGSPGITSGKHYWEVDVSKKSAWILGLNSGSCLQPQSILGHRQNTRYQPKHGYWVIGLKNQFEYTAFVDSADTHTLSLTLSLPLPPQRIGVFVDFEARTLSFYNVTNPTFLICKFSPCSFPSEVYPYFNPMQCPEPMTLCDVQKP